MSLVWVSGVFVAAQVGSLAIVGASRGWSTLSVSGTLLLLAWSVVQGLGLVLAFALSRLMSRRQVVSLGVAFVAVTLALMLALRFATVLARLQSVGWLGLAISAGQFGAYFGIAYSLGRAFGPVRRDDAWVEDSGRIALAAYVGAAVMWLATTLLIPLARGGYLGSWLTILPTVPFWVAFGASSVRVSQRLVGSGISVPEVRAAIGETWDGTGGRYGRSTAVVIAVLLACALLVDGTATPCYERRMQAAGSYMYGSVLTGMPPGVGAGLSCPLGIGYGDHLTCPVHGRLSVAITE